MYKVMLQKIMVLWLRQMYVQPQLAQRLDSF